MARIKNNLGFILALAFCLLYLGWRYFYPTERPINDINDAKWALENKVYHDHRITIYCGASYDREKQIKLPPGFKSRGSGKRAGRMEWEHAVPAEIFGRHFAEWTDSSSFKECRREKLKGRKCANRISEAYQKIERDMYNLFPAIGSVNASRSNREYTELPETSQTFGSCEARVAPGKFEPPDAAKGQLARASLYMAAKYPHEVIFPVWQQELFERWNKDFPVDQWECERARRIAKIQKNENQFVKEPCEKARL